MLSNQFVYQPYILVIELVYVLCNDAVDIVFFGFYIVILKLGNYYHIGLHWSSSSCLLVKKHVRDRFCYIKKPSLNIFLKLVLSFQSELKQAIVRLVRLMNSYDGKGIQATRDRLD